MASAYSCILLSNVSGTGPGPANSWPGGKGIITASGTFNGALLTVSFQAADGLWVPVSTPTGSRVVLNAPGQAVFETPAGQIRAELTGGTPTGITSSAGGVG